QARAVPPRSPVRGAVARRCRRVILPRTLRGGLLLRHSGREAIHKATMRQVSSSAWEHLDVPGGWAGQREQEREGGPHLLLALDPHLSPVRLDETLDDRQPETRTPVLAGDGVVDLV